MGHVWSYVERHMAETPYGASERQIAKAAGINHTTLTAWKTIRRLPQPEHLRAVARQINVPYRVLLDAALIDAGYLEDRAHVPPITRAGGSPADDGGTTPLVTDEADSTVRIVGGSRSPRPDDPPQDQSERP